MKAEKGWFEKWFDSPYYRELYYNGNQKDRAGFINKLLNFLKPSSPSYILDVACGNGRDAVLFSEKGFDVTGIDHSGKNIIEAKKNENDGLHFFQHDMRLPFWINYFDYAFSLFTGFGYFNTRRENENALRTVCESLKNNGVFVIDYTNAHYEEESSNKGREMQSGGINYAITKANDDAYFYKKIIIKDDKLKEPLEIIEKVAKFSLGDFTDMLSYHQMQVQQVFGDYDLNNYDIKKSPRMIIVAKKMLH